MSQSPPLQKRSQVAVTSSADISGRPRMHYLKLTADTSITTKSTSVLITRDPESTIYHGQGMPYIAVIEYTIRRDHEIY